MSLSHPCSPSTLNTIYRQDDDSTDSTETALDILVSCDTASYSLADVTLALDDHGRLCGSGGGHAGAQLLQ